MNLFILLAVMAGEPRPPEAVTLDDVLKLLSESSPRSFAERARADVAAAELVAAGVLPNPSISYGGLHLVQGQSTGAVTQHQLIVEQPLLVFGQRGARRDAAGLGVATAQAQARAAFADRALQVRQSFATLLARQQRLKLLDDARQDLERVEHVVQGRVAAGDKSRYDGLRIEIETRAIGAQIKNAQADVDDGAGHLATLLGFPGWRPRALGDLNLTAVDASVETLWKQAREKRPALVAAERSQAQARGAVTLARRERLPIPTVGAGMSLTREVNGNSLYLGLSIPVPLFDRGQGAISRATAEARAVGLAADAELAEARADLERAVAVLAQRRTAYDELSREVIERLPTLRTMAEQSYREGRGGILELLDAFRVLKEMQQVHVERRLEVKLAEVETLFLAGLIDGEPAQR